MSNNRKTYQDYKREEERAEAIAAFRDKSVKKLKEAFSMKTKKQKVTKLGLAGLFMAMAVPFGVQEITQDELTYMRVQSKEMIVESETTTVSELFQLEEMQNKWKGGEWVEELEAVDEEKQLSQDRDETVRRIIELDDGKRYLIDSNLLQGFTQGEADDLWDEIKQGDYYNFTVSKTITGENVITDYEKRTSYYNYNSRNYWNGP